MRYFFCQEGLLYQLRQEGEMKLNNLTRRKFLKTAGAGSLLLAASPLSLLSATSKTAPEFLNIFPLHSLEELIRFNFNGGYPAPSVKIGETIRFMPMVSLDGYNAIDEGDDVFNHIILNIYEFTFRPVLKNSITYTSNLTPEEKQEHQLEDIPDIEYFEDYLIKISSKFFAGYYRLKETTDTDLHVGQLYKGYGKFGNYDWDFLSFDTGISERLEAFKLNVKVDEILDYDVYKTWRHNKQLWTYWYVNMALCDDYVEDKNLLYYDDFDRFKKAVAPYRNQFSSIQTNRDCMLPTYRLRII
jgi:hypothetical protein